MNVQYGLKKTQTLCVVRPPQKISILLDVTISHFSFSATELRTNRR